MTNSQSNRIRSTESSCDGETTVGTGASVLSDEMTQLKSRTVEDDWLEAHIVGVESLDSETIGLTVEHPINGDEELMWRFDKPTVWNNQSTFVQLIEQLGYDAETIDLLAGEPVLIKRDVGVPGLIDRYLLWTLNVPASPDETAHCEENGQYRGFAKSAIANCLTIAVPFMAVAALIAIVIVVVPTIANWRILIKFTYNLLWTVAFVVWAIAITYKFIRPLTHCNVR